MSKGWGVTEHAYILSAMHDSIEGEEHFWECELCQTGGKESEWWYLRDEMADHVASAEHRDRMARCNTWTGNPVLGSMGVWGYCLLPAAHGGEHVREVRAWEQPDLAR